MSFDRSSLKSDAGSFFRKFRPYPSLLDFLKGSALSHTVVEICKCSSSLLLFMLHGKNAKKNG